MLDPETYRANERLAKCHIPSWRVSQVHNVDHFERSGFPVRITSARELGQIIDTMQENRFDLYMKELGGLDDDEFAFVVEACEHVVRFQLSFLPHRRPVLPISTLLSAFALYKKMRAFDKKFQSVLEIGPGCGYLSFFLRRHSALKNYSQIEACESFYILQNLVNLYCFGHRFDERAFPPEDVPAVDYFVNNRPDMEFAPAIRFSDGMPLCVHYPWWRIGEIVSRDIRFDIVTSNANLLEFNTSALDDYLALMHRSLNPSGIFLVQCTGFTASGSVEQLLDKMHERGFAPLTFVRANEAAIFPRANGKSHLLNRLTEREHNNVMFTTNNAIFVKAGHELFERYYDRRNYHQHFIAPESLVSNIFFERPTSNRTYSVNDFLVATENALKASYATGDHEGN